MKTDPTQTSHEVVKKNPRNLNIRVENEIK